MNPWLSFALFGLASWLIGSIPFSLLVARWVGGIDLRKHGSGNVGATNVARTLGAKWGAVALLLDAMKGAIPVLAAWALPVSAAAATHQQVLCGTLAIVGHMFSTWLNFRGGKGVATGLGAATVLAPLSTLIAFVAFLIVWGLSRLVSLSSIVAALTFAVVQVAYLGPKLWTSRTWSLGVFSIAVPVLILIRHRSNMVRLWKGEESRLQFHSSGTDPEPSEKSPAAGP